MIAATVFYKGASSATSVPAGLFDAHDLIKEHIGKGAVTGILHVIRECTLTDAITHRTAAAFIFALALLCAGQTASITATLAGQIVSEGFIEWRVSVRLRVFPGAIGDCMLMHCHDPSSRSSAA